MRPFDCPFAVLEDAAMSIRNDERFTPRDEWFKVVAGIYDATGGNDEGFELAERWSATRTDGPHDPKETKRVWTSLRKDGGARKVNAAFPVTSPCSSQLVRV